MRRQKQDNSLSFSLCHFFSLTEKPPTLVMLANSVGNRFFMAFQTKLQPCLLIASGDDITLVQYTSALIITTAKYISPKIEVRQSSRSENETKHELVICDKGIPYTIVPKAKNNP